MTTNHRNLKSESSNPRMEEEFIAFEQSSTVANKTTSERNDKGIYISFSTGSKNKIRINQFRELEIRNKLRDLYE